MFITHVSKRGAVHSAAVALVRVRPHDFPPPALLMVHTPIYVYIRRLGAYKSCTHAA